MPLLEAESPCFVGSNCVSAIRRGTRSFGPNDDSFFCWPSTLTLLHMAAGDAFINHSPHQSELLEAILDH
jgi:hypothetical protein